MKHTLLLTNNELDFLRDTLENGVREARREKRVSDASLAHRLLMKVYKVQEIENAKNS